MYFCVIVCTPHLPLDFVLFVAPMSVGVSVSLSFGSVAAVRFLLIFWNLCSWLCFRLIPALSINTTVHPIVFCTAVSFYFYVENPYICRWIYFGLIPALSVNTTVHSVVYVAAGSYDRHRHIYRYFDFTPATDTAWFYINRKKL